MTRFVVFGVCCFSLVSLVSVSAYAAPIMQPGDPIIAIDGDGMIEFVRESAYPPGPNGDPPSGTCEGPINVTDQNPGTKYLNFGTWNTGFIVTPFLGPTTVESMQFVTANDQPGRDPAAWQLFGTNDPITSPDNSAGDSENWTLIAENAIELPEDRHAEGPLLTFENSTSYSSYRLVFPTTKAISGALTGEPTLAGSAANSMQLADVYLWESNDGTGFSMANEGDGAIAIQTDSSIFSSDSRFPMAEGPINAIDGDTDSKYLNMGRENSGFIVTPSIGSEVVEAFQITTANDFPNRDPTSWELYGTNEPIVSEMNSDGNGESWTLIDAGSIELPEDRHTAGDMVSVANSTAYSSYKMIFPTMRHPEPLEDQPENASDSIQYSEIQFFSEASGGLPGDFDNDGVVDGQDFLLWQRDTSIGSLADWEANFGSGSPLTAASAVPEPGCGILLAWAICGAVHFRMRSRRP